MDYHNIWNIGRLYYELQNSWLDFRRLNRVVVRAPAARGSDIVATLCIGYALPSAL